MDDEKRTDRTDNVDKGTAPSSGAKRPNGNHTVWSSDRRRNGRTVPAGSVAAAANERRAATPAPKKPIDKQPAPTAGEKKRSATTSAPRSTGRPQRATRHAQRVQELPRMDDLLIDDTPIEPDISPDEYVPSDADVDRILQYELCTPQSRRIPAVIPADKVVIIGVKFRAGGKTYFFDPGDHRSFSLGQPVIVETARGVEFGEVSMGIRLVDASQVVPPLRPLVRIATSEDILHDRRNREAEREACRIGAERIRAHKQEMKLVGAQYTFDNSKLLFYFTSDGRVDFRELVKDLAGVFRVRIELRQIGIRDEARMIGGLGPCGRALCCSTFLSDFGQVSMKMAKEQCLSLNASKISGCCGRLMCCLRYEHETYMEELRRSPAPGSFVMTPDGLGVVTEVFPVAGEVKVSLRGQNEPTFRRFKRDQVSVQAPGSRPGEATPDARRAARGAATPTPEDDLADPSVPDAPKAP